MPVRALTDNLDFDGMPPPRKCQLRIVSAPPRRYALERLASLGPQYLLVVNKHKFLNEACRNPIIRGIQIVLLGRFVGITDSDKELQLVEWKIGI